MMNFLFLRVNCFLFLIQTSFVVITSFYLFLQDLILLWNMAKLKSFIFLNCMKLSILLHEISCFLVNQLCFSSLSRDIWASFLIASYCFEPISTSMQTRLSQLSNIWRCWGIWQETLFLSRKDNYISIVLSL